MISDNQFNELFSKTGFSTPRANQKETILKVISAYDAGKKYVIINAPVGFGKSAASYTVAQSVDSTYFLTHQKILQEQYLKDFGMPWVASSANYECNIISDCSCKQCMRVSLGMARCQNCKYAVAKRKAFESPQCSLNYAFMFSLSGALRQQFKEQSRELIVCDEAHLLSDELISRGTIEIRAQQHLKMQNSYNTSISLTLPDFSEMTDEDAVSWVMSEYASFVSNKKGEIASQLSSFKGMKSIPEKKKGYFRRLTWADTYYTQHKCQISDLCDFAFNSMDDIVVIKGQDFIQIKPLSSRGLFQPLLGQFGQKFLFMSGTILDKDYFCQELNIDPNDCEYISLNSDFPVDNRPIYYWPIGSLVYHEKKQTIPKMVLEIDKLLSKYSNVKGIIHTANYELANAIHDNLLESENFNRLLFINAKNKIEMMNQFELSNQPLILVSPSLSEGIDLKNDLSRLCIICKVPYASLGDLWVKRKIKSDKRWYPIKTAETIIQQTGRSIRSKEDHADTYILDAEFQNFFNKSQHLFPEWWKDSISWL